MKKVVKSLDKKAKEDWKAAGKNAKEHRKAEDPIAQEAWRKVGQDIKKGTED